MKVGIMTFHRAINYGAVLQAYALRKKVEQLGGEAEVIDYRCKKITRDYSLNPFFAKNIKDFVFRLCSAPYLSIRKNKFNSFLKQEINMSEKLNIIGKDVSEKYDVVISGSDQVWQYYLTGDDEEYFLCSFPKSKKISYAASFVLSDNKINPRQLKYLDEFNALSTRESETAKYLAEKLNKEILTVCDPSLLLNKRDWSILVEKRGRVIKEKYILAFNVQKTNGMLQFAESMAKKYDCKLVVLTTSIKKSVNAKYIRTAGPEEFLSLINYAEMVVTNSFHGTAFSVIFEKQFYVEMISGGGLYNTRVKNLLENLHIYNRAIDEYKENEQIDYNEIMAYKEKMLSDAERFLKNNLS